MSGHADKQLSKAGGRTSANRPSSQAVVRTPPLYKISAIDTLAQPMLKVGASNDKYEKEANHIASNVVNGARSRSASAISTVNAAPAVQKMGQEGASSQMSDSSRADSAEAEPLSEEVQAKIEPHVGTGLDHVKVHSGRKANRAAGSLQSRAFTHRNNIYLNRGESKNDLFLMAHESTHVVQQTGGAAIQRMPLISTTGLDIQLLSLPGVDDIFKFARKYAKHIPGYDVLSLILGKDPLTGAKVDRNAANVVKALIGSIPGGHLIYTVLHEKGILQPALKIIEEGVGKYDLSLSRIKRIFNIVFDQIGFFDLFTGDFVDILKANFGPLLFDIKRFATSLVPRLIQLVKDAFLNLASGLLDGNKAWALFKKILGYDPITKAKVTAEPVEILVDFLLLIGRETELEQMKARGTLKKTADWLATQWGVFSSLISEIPTLIQEAWTLIQPQNLADYNKNLSALISKIGNYLGRVWDFAKTVVSKAFEFIKQSFLNWLKNYVSKSAGYRLITVILGKDVITGRPVERSPLILMEHFMALFPGGKERFDQLNQSGVIPEAAAQVEKLLATLNITWSGVTALFLAVWDALSIQDLLEPIAAFKRIASQFGKIIGRLFTFVTEVVKIIITLILQVMQFPIHIVQKIIANAAEAFETIKSDPIGFLKNMLSSFRLGFANFFTNILTHLFKGVTDWLFKQIAKTGIKPPEELTVESVFDVVLQILGITTEKIWERLANRIGQEKVDKIRGAIDMLSGVWTFIKDVQEGGIAAIWEHISDQISGLWDLVVEKVQNWVVTKIINQMVAKLLKLLDPTGVMAVIEGFKFIFNAIQSAVEYARDMLVMVSNFTETIVNIAKGDIEPGAIKLEMNLGQGLPVAIGFLANYLGLGDLGSRLKEIIQGVQLTIEKALDWLIDKAVEVGHALLQFGKSGINKAFDILSLKRPFKSEDGAKHTVYFSENHGRIVPFVQSKPIAIDALLKDKRNEINQLADGRRKAKLLKHILAIEKLLQKISSISYPEKPSATVDPSKADSILSEFTPHLATLMAGNPAKAVVPRMVANPGFSSGMAKSPASYRYIFNGSGNHQEGSTPQGKTNEQAVGILRALGVSSKWVRFHILNENLGGKGVESNLIPMLQSDNKAYLHQFEKKLKTAFKEGEVLWLEAQFNYQEDQTFIKNFKAEGGRMRLGKQNSLWEKDHNATIAFPSMSVQPPQAGEIYLNFLLGRHPKDPFTINAVIEQTDLPKTALKAAFDYADAQGWPYFGTQNVSEMEQFKQALVGGGKKYLRYKDSYLDKIQADASKMNINWDRDPPEWA